MFSLVLGLVARCRWLTLSTALLLPWIREDTGVLLVAVGLWLLVREHNRWPLALALIGWGGGWVVLSTNYDAGWYARWDASLQHRGAEGVTDGNEGIFDHASRRSIAVDAFPIGIDPSRFEQCLETDQVKDRIIDLQRRFDGKKVLLGIDRLDYVKGIPHKLKAVEKFLQMYPSMANKIVLVQIAVPSRVDVPGYQKLRSNVHRLVTRINGEFGSLEDVPIHYLDQSVSLEELVSLYAVARRHFMRSTPPFPYSTWLLGTLWARTSRLLRSSPSRYCRELIPRKIFYALVSTGTGS